MGLGHAVALAGLLTLAPGRIYWTIQRPTCHVFATDLGGIIADVHLQIWKMGVARHDYGAVEGALASPPPICHTTVIFIDNCKWRINEIVASRICDTLSMILGLKRVSASRNRTEDEIRFFSHLCTVDTEANVTSCPPVGRPLD